LLEKMQAGVLAKSRGSGVLAWLLRLALRSASNVYEAKQKGMSAGIIDQICYKGLVSIRHKIKNQLFGLSFKYAISGGAKLNPETAKFFAILDIEVLEGYGLTETCVATNVNRLGRNKIGAVGPVLDHDIELRIAEDGEILFRGPNITSGYYKREAATKAAWDEAGWFYTGDLGEIDPEGYLKIVGRKKDILVTSYGKNIAPEPIEAQLKDSCYISQAVMVGDARPYCIAIVTIDQAAVELWANKKGIESEGDLGSNELVIALIHQEVEVVNQRLANYEAIKKVIVLGEDFTVENGLLTPTFKIKKKLVLEKYNRQIEAAYS